jgi:pyrimidine deaminase RibD-like protein
MKLSEIYDPDRYEIHNLKKLDHILVELCEMIVRGQQKDADHYGMVAACVLDPDNQPVFGINQPADNGTRVHAERVAMDKYNREYGEIPQGSIIITTLSPCNKLHDKTADDRYGESCTDLVNNSPVRKVYCGYMDPSQGDDRHDEREFTLLETANPDIRRLCEKFAATFLTIYK